jgi:hypothetical protein
LLKSQLQELQESADTHPWKLRHKPQGSSPSRVSSKAKKKVAETTKAAAQQNPYLSYDEVTNSVPLLMASPAKKSTEEGFTLDIASAGPPAMISAVKVDSDGFRTVTYIPKRKKKKNHHRCPRNKHCKTSAPAPCWYWQLSYLASYLKTGKVQRPLFLDLAQRLLLIC